MRGWMWIAVTLTLVGAVVGLAAAMPEVMALEQPVTTPGLVLAGLSVPVAAIPLAVLTRWAWPPEYR